MKYKNFLNRLFFKAALLGLVSHSIIVFSQQSAVLTDVNIDFKQAVSLYSDGQYLSALVLFEDVKSKNKSAEIQSECSYFIATCAIKANQANADLLMENFLKNHPTSIRSNQASREVATYYFSKNQFDKSLEWFEKVEESNLNKNQMAALNFQKGYSYFKIADKNQAVKYLSKVENDVEYGSQAIYYLGFIAYQSDNYEEANKQFNKVSNNNSFAQKMSYFQADMNFKTGNFQEAINLGKMALLKSSDLEISELNKIIGESHFNLNQFSEAIPFLQAYKGKQGKWNNVDFYRLGYSFYMIKDYERAISQFNKIVDGNDFVAQNAFYHLGESYLKSNKKQQALNAFKSASEMNFNQKIQEDSFLNYAKLSYEIGNAYQSAPDVLRLFLDKYPKNPNNTEIETLLVNSYVTAKNYKAALFLLEKNKTAANKEAYQKVTFYRGLEFFTDKKFEEALNMFKKSISEPKDLTYLAQATFWKAETEFALNKFEDSLISYQAFSFAESAKNTAEFSNITYNLGYNYYKLKQFDQAIVQFDKYCKENPTDKMRLVDALVRLGDSQFVLGKYWPAMDAYAKAVDLKSINDDYASFQKAICYGFVNKNDKKIEALLSFINQFSNSQYRDDAIFELGNAYVVQGNSKNAMATFDKLISEIPNSLFIPKAILKQGLIYYNSDKDDLALVKLKIVAKDYSDSPEALEAVATARLIYLDAGKVNDYAIWVKTLNFIEVTDVELDNDSFEVAEKQYLQADYAKAINALESYLERFSNGRHALKANFYLAQACVTSNLDQKAIPRYAFVIATNRNQFTDQSLLRLAEIYLQQNDAENAITILKRVEKESESPQNVIFAQTNLMKLYNENKDVKMAVLYAENVINNTKVDGQIKNDAQVIIARNAVITNDFAKARGIYAALLPIAKGALAAEALYYDAYFKNVDLKYDASNVAIEKLTKNFGGYKLYGAKALVLMAKNFYGLKDAFQANFILDSVIKNFTDFPDVIEDAKTEQAKIRAEESKTNTSVK